MGNVGGEAAGTTSCAADLRLERAAEVFTIGENPWSSPHDGEETCSIPWPLPSAQPRQQQQRHQQPAKLATPRSTPVQPAAAPSAQPAAATSWAARVKQGADAAAASTQQVQKQDKPQQAPQADQPWVAAGRHEASGTSARAKAQLLKEAHRSTPHPITGTLKCLACSRTFASYQALAAHVGKSHGGRNSEDVKYLAVHQAASAGTAGPSASAVASSSAKDGAQHRQPAPRARPTPAAAVFSLADLIGAQRPAPGRAAASGVRVAKRTASSSRAPGAALSSRPRMSAAATAALAAAAAAQGLRLRRQGRKKRPSTLRRLIVRERADKALGAATAAARQADDALLVLRSQVQALEARLASANAGGADERIDAAVLGLAVQQAHFQVAVAERLAGERLAALRRAQAAWDKAHRVPEAAEAGDEDSQSSPTLAAASTAAEEQQVGAAAATPATATAAAVASPTPPTAAGTAAVGACTAQAEPPPVSATLPHALPTTPVAAAAAAVAAPQQGSHQQSQEGAQCAAASAGATSAASSAATCSDGADDDDEWTSDDSDDDVAGLAGFTDVLSQWAGGAGLPRVGAAFKAASSAMSVQRPLPTATVPAGPAQQQQQKQPAVLKPVLPATASAVSCPSPAAPHQPTLAAQEQEQQQQQDAKLDALQQTAGATKPSTVTAANPKVLPAAPKRQQQQQQAHQQQAHQQQDQGGDQQAHDIQLAHTASTAVSMRSSEPGSTTSLQLGHVPATAAPSSAMWGNALNAYDDSDSDDDVVLPGWTNTFASWAAQSTLPATGLSKPPQPAATRTAIQPTLSRAAPAAAAAAAFPAAERSQQPGDAGWSPLHHDTYVLRAGSGATSQLQAAVHALKQQEDSPALAGLGGLSPGSGAVQGFNPGSSPVALSPGSVGVSGMADAEQIAAALAAMQPSSTAAAGLGAADPELQELARLLAAQQQHTVLNTLCTDTGILFHTVVGSSVERVPAEALLGQHSPMVPALQQQGIMTGHQTFAGSQGSVLRGAPQAPASWQQASASSSIAGVQGPAGQWYTDEWGLARQQVQQQQEQQHMQASLEALLYQQQQQQQEEQESQQRGELLHQAEQQLLQQQQQQRLAVLQAQQRQQQHQPMYQQYQQQGASAPSVAASIRTASSTWPSTAAPSAISHQAHHSSQQHPRPPQLPSQVRPVPLQQQLAPSLPGPQPSSMPWQQQQQWHAKQQAIAAAAALASVQQQQPLRQLQHAQQHNALPGFAQPCCSTGASNRNAPPPSFGKSHYNLQQQQQQQQRPHHQQHGKSDLPRWQGRPQRQRTDCCPEDTDDEEYFPAVDAAPGPLPPGPGGRVKLRPKKQLRGQGAAARQVLSADAPDWTPTAAAGVQMAASQSWSNGQPPPPPKQQQQQLLLQHQAQAPQMFTCELCSLSCNSALTLQQHLTSRRHLQRAAYAAVAPITQAVEALQQGRAAAAAAGDAAAGSSGTQAMTHVGPQAAVHSYCEQEITAELNDAVTQLLQQVKAAQDKAMARNPTKASLHRWYICGLREVKKAVKQHKARCIVLAPNIEAMECEGGLNDQLAGILEECKEAGTPVVYALSRKRLGEIYGFRKRMSAIALLETQNAEELFARVLALAVEGRKSWSAAHAAT